MRFPSCLNQRFLAIFILSLDVGAAVEQQLHHRLALFVKLCFAGEMSVHTLQWTAPSWAVASDCSSLFHAAFTADCYVGNTYTELASGYDHRRGGRATGCFNEGQMETPMHTSITMNGYGPLLELKPHRQPGRYSTASVEIEVYGISPRACDHIVTGNGSVEKHAPL